MKEIPLTQGYTAIVDDDDFEKFGKFKWFAKFGGRGGQPYAARSVRVNGTYKTIRLHRAIMGDPEGMDVDHNDRKTMNNRKSNLTILTHEENLAKRRQYESAEIANNDGETVSEFSF
jgi:hypothetical protein